MKLKRTFVGSKINKDLDERLLPAGEYPHAENIRVANTDASDVGAVENVKGNISLTDFNLTNAVTIGVFSDSSNQKIYWFTTSDEKDMVVEYDLQHSTTNILLSDTRPNGVLNFDRNYLITGVCKIINGDSNKDLLIWTDDYNPPRKINIERAKTYGLDGFDKDDISLIKKPPRFAPKVQLTFTTSTLENNLEDKFLSFAYRYKYLDGEYSALSSYTNYKFAPDSFDLDYQTMENNGMVNFFNALNIVFDTGDHRVTDVEIVLKEANSNTLYLVESFNKKKENWGNNEQKSFKFSNSKKYVALPDDELYRQFDNVPRLAKALEIIGNRIVFGNYVEGYDLIDIYGQDVYMNYDVSLINKELLGTALPVSYASPDIMTIDFSDISLVSDSRINFEFFLKELSGGDGEYNNELDFILNRNYSGIDDLAQDPDFIFFIEEIVTNNFLQNYTNTPPPDSEIGTVTKFAITGYTATTISIKAPVIEYIIDDTPTDPNDNPANTHTETRTWIYDDSSNVYFKEISVDTSLKTNRSYEVGCIYLDEYNRATTVLTDVDNTMYIPQEFSNYQNKLMVNIHNNPPYWADRYKLVVKQNKANYQTIYTNIFYEDGLFRWVKLEGANKDKVKEGDTLIVKSDLGGIVRDLVKVRVLEVTTKEKNFIEGNENVDGDEIIEEQGLYMKIKPVGFDMNFNDATSRTFGGSQHLRYPNRVWTNPKFGEGDPFVPYLLGAGSTVRIYINFKAKGSIAYNVTYDKRFRVEGDYNSVQEWFEAEVKNLGTFGKDYTWNGLSDIGNNIEDGHGEADEWNQYSGWGWRDDGSQFFVVPHRKGTASRNITSTVRFEILFTEGTVIFETEPENTVDNIYFETEQTFEIIDGKHMGNIQNQDVNNPAIVEMDFYNCYVQGNGAESYRYKDTFNTPNFLNIDLRPSTTDVSEYAEIRRYADLTYSEPYNENNNLNGLNEFNLSRANFKDNIDKKYGYIQKLHSRDTDLLVFQEDKVSKVMYGKDLLMNADGTSNVTSIEDVLGEQITFKGEYGISRNPESFSFDGFNIYFSDAKRGAIMRLSAEGLFEISSYGLRQFFKDQFKSNFDSKKLGGYDPYYDEYVIHPTQISINAPINIDCSGNVIKSGFSGDQVINIDYGMLTGQAGFSYNTSGVPIKFTVEWNGNIYNTGYLGDPQYNGQLADLGLPPVSGSGTGTFYFDKDEMLPRSAKVTVSAPLCDTNFELTGLCIFSPEKQVFFIVTNDPYYENKSCINRFKWAKGGYGSSYKSDNTIFGAGKVTHFENLTGNQGTGFIPLNGSDIFMESYSLFNSENIFSRGGRFGYLLSNTLYTAADIEGIMDDFTYLTATETVYPNGDVLNRGSFVLPTSFSQNYIYLLFDYQAPLEAVDDYFNVERGESDDFDVLENDITYGLPVDVVIVTPPLNGTAVVNPDKTVHYVHNNSETPLNDSFTYKLVYNGRESNIATVNIDIALGCDGTFAQTGGTGYFELPISYGTATGECGITYNMFTIPDQAVIMWNGVEVATTGGLVSGTGSLTFNKTSALPTVATVIMTAPNEGTQWTITGICPNVSLSKRSMDLEKYVEDNELTEDEL